MQLSTLRTTIAPFIRSLNPTATLSLSSIRFTSSSTSNPANFHNRPKEQVSEIAHKGGKKGGKARGRGAGGFRTMDPEKQHAAASKGGHASKRGKKSKNDEDTFPMKLGEPSATAPGFDESNTA